MRIEDVRIEEHGSWRELSLSFPNPAVNVLYGPNEAGKSTLLRFLRGMLFGRRRPLGHREPGSLEGRLALEHGGRRYSLSRRYDDTRDRVELVDETRQTSAPLDDLLQGIDREVYESVYAVGLREMQELGTLDAESVAEWLYGTSLGPAGRSLGTISTRTRALRGRLQSGPGSLATLQEEYARLSKELEGHSGGPRVDALLAERTEVDAKIADIRRRQETHQRNLRGLRFLERVHEPWERVRSYRAELADLDGTSVSQSLVTQLDRIEREVARANDEREAARGELGQLVDRYKRTGGNDAFVEQSCAIRGLLEMRDDAHDTGPAVPVDDERAAEARRQLAEARAALGDEWTDSRLDRAEAVNDGQRRLTAAARVYQKSLVRRARIRRLRKRIAKTVQKRQAELHERTRELAGQSVNDAIDERRARLGQLEDLGRLRSRAAELEQRRQGLVEQIERTRQRAAVPDWVYGVLCFFGIVGAVFCVLGLATGITTSALVGAIYAFLGLTCGGLAWGLKSHFEQELREALEQLREEEAAAEVELRETHARIAKLAGVGAAHPTTAKALEQQREQDAALLSETVRELIDLERLSERIESTIRLRKRQTALRNRFHSVQRELATARQQWTTTLRALTLTEVLKTEDAQDEWDHVAAAIGARGVLRLLQTGGRRGASERFHARVRAMAAKLGESSKDVDSLLDRWQARIDGLAQHRDERRQLRSRIRSQQAIARRAGKRLAVWEERRRALFRRVGVKARDAFLALAGKAERRTELVRLLENAENELRAAAESDADLAIVEEQLVDFDSANTRETIELTELELEELEDTLGQLHVELGRIKQALAEAETDDRLATLRYDRERVYERLRDAYRELAAVELVDRAAHESVEHLERNHQPATLAEASRILERLTLGRYDRIWTPFGESRLLVNGSGREAFGVEQLSRGTREQVFLALRLALVAHLGEQGVELPFVLDDVFVNFDRERTEAAVDCLLDFSGEGRQVLFFTCHQHVAEMFEQRGIDPIWLPTGEPQVRERLAG